MDDYSSIILVAFVIMLFTVFSLSQLKTGFKNLQREEGSHARNMLRVAFATPLLFISLIALALFLISLIP